MNSVRLVLLCVVVAVGSGCARGVRQEPAVPPAAVPGSVPAPEPLPAPVPDPAAPEAWYEREIRAFEARDRADPPEPGQVLFIGSSSFRLWETLEADMAPAPVLNRGFGGSKTAEVLAVFDRLVVPYAPTVIVYYCGDNDLGESNTDWESAANGFIAFDRLARTMWPDVRVLNVPIKASVARWGNWEAMSRANAAVREYCQRTPGAEYLDTVTPTLGADGRPDASLFKPDGLHLNAAGYARWTPVVRTAVVRAWEERSSQR